MTTKRNPGPVGRLGAQVAVAGAAQSLRDDVVCCASCNRVLTAPTSVRRGLGPVCAHRHIGGVRESVALDLRRLECLAATGESTAVLATIRAAVEDLRAALYTLGAWEVPVVLGPRGGGSR